MAAASLGRLTLDLLVKLGSFEQGMTQAERKAKQTADNMGKAFAGFKAQISDALGGTQIGSIIDGFTSKFGSLKGGVLVAGAAITGMAVGGVAVGIGALSTMAIQAAKADAQLQILANRANISTKNFQVLEYAASSLGVSQDQLGFIFADVQEKLGEFSATKGGGAADFFDALKNNTKMTDDQIKAFGKTLQGKDGVEAVQMLNDKMDELGATSQERRFVFESLASDLGNLAPLFAENGSLLTQYGEALEEAGVIKSKEALEQSKLLAAQTESVRMRFEGFKTQLTAQMMPALNSVIGYFIEGAGKGGQFGGVIQSVGVIAKGVGVVIIGVAASIEVLIKLIKGFIDQGKNVADTAVNVWNADGAKAKAQALAQGFSTSFGLAKDTFVDGATAIQKAMDGAAGVIDSSLPKLDKLSEANLAVANAAQQSAKGIQTDTKTADENAKAAEKQAAAKAKLNKELQVNAKVQANAAKYGFSNLESQYKLPSGLLSAINMQESRGNASAIGPQTKYGTAKGGFQFLDGTAKRFGLLGDDVYNTGKSAEAAAKYFQYLYEKFGSWEKAISAYHAGEGNVERGTGLGPINREYVKNVMGYMDSVLKATGTTASDAIQYTDDQYKAQQSIVFQYLSEREKMEVEHGAKILEIQKAFAGDDSAIKKYTDLQKTAYQKDVAEFEIALKQKQFSAINAYKQMQDAIKGLSVNADNIFAQATMSTADYASWSLANDRDNAKAALKNQHVGVQQDIMSASPDVYATDDDRYAALLQAHQEYRDGLAAIDVQYDQQVKDLAQSQYETQMSIWQDLLTRTGSIFGQVAEMVKNTAGESSAAYKAMFFANQMISGAQAVVNTEVAATKAMAEGGYVAGIPMATAIRALGYTSVGLIAAQTISGMAHDGIDNIPKEGTWLLDKGERVVDSRTNADLKDYLAKGGGSGGDINITVNVTDSGVTTQSNQSDQKQLGQMIGNAVRAVIRQEQRQGGLLAR